MRSTYVYEFVLIVSAPIAVIRPCCFDLYGFPSGRMETWMGTLPEKK